MAYNVLDGTVDYSTTQHTELVDAHATQEIKGVKIISGKLLTVDGKEIVPPAITTIKGGTQHSVLTYELNGEARAQNHLTFDGKTLQTKDVRATSFHGAGTGLTDLPPNRFSDQIDARFLKLGRGLTDVRHHLQLQVGDGLALEPDGVSVSLVPKGGLRMREHRLGVDPKNCLPIDDSGQNLSDDDVLMVHDSSRSEVRHTTLKNLYSAYVHAKIPRAAGQINSIQLKASNGFNASSNLTYDPHSNILNIDGSIVTDALTVTGRTSFEGPVAQNIKTVNEPRYTVQPGDYTILGDTSNHKTTITLPAACNHKGRIVVIKKINAQKFKLNSHLLTIDVDEGEIDFKTKIDLKINYSTITVQSDGKKWWVIGKTGT